MAINGMDRDRGGSIKIDYGDRSIGPKRMTVPALGIKRNPNGSAVGRFIDRVGTYVGERLDKTDLSGPLGALFTAVRPYLPYRTPITQRDPKHFLASPNGRSVLQLGDNLHPQPLTLFDGGTAKILWRATQADSNGTATFADDNSFIAYASSAGAPEFSSSLGVRDARTGTFMHGIGVKATPDEIATNVIDIRLSADNSRVGVYGLHTKAPGENTFQWHAFETKTGVHLGSASGYLTAVRKRRGVVYDIVDVLPKNAAVVDLFDPNHKVKLASPTHYWSASEPDYPGDFVTTPDENYVVGTSSSTIHFWDAITGTYVGHAPNGRDNPSLGYGRPSFIDPTSHRVASGFAGYATVWDAATAQVVRELRVGGELKGFSKEGLLRVEALTLLGKRIKLWDINAGRFVGVESLT
jgi:hypothetical protein